MKKWLLFSLIAFTVLVLDIITKAHFLNTMQPGETIPVIGKVFSWHLTFNKGALFGLNPADFIPGISANLFFYIFTAIALGILVNYIRTMELTKEPLILFIGLATVAGGALGNLTDRIIPSREGVVDFIMVDLGFRLGPIPFDPWPIFNVADIGITCGLTLILVGNFMADKQEKNPML